MKLVSWITATCSMAAWMTVLGVLTWLASTYWRIEAIQGGYGDDWMIVFNPISAAVTLMCGFSLRGRGWFQFGGFIALLSFLATLGQLYVTSSQSEGLARLGTLFAMLIAVVTGISFAGYLLFVGILIAVVEWRNQFFSKPTAIETV